MKKNGVLCIAIAVALLVGGVAAVSASSQNAGITQTQSGTQGITNSNAITTGAVTMGGGNVIAQGVLSLNIQGMLGNQCAGIIGIGDWSPWSWNRIC